MQPGTLELRNEKRLFKIEARWPGAVNNRYFIERYNEWYDDWQLPQEAQRQAQQAIAQVHQETKTKGVWLGGEGMAYTTTSFKDQRKVEAVAEALKRHGFENVCILESKETETAIYV